jgi:p-hydroxybenzoate 3-monooxygenase
MHISPMRRSTGLPSSVRRSRARLRKTERFSWSVTLMLHRLPDMDAFGRRIGQAGPGFPAGARAVSAMLAEDHVGLPCRSEPA